MCTRSIGGVGSSSKMMVHLIRFGFVILRSRQVVKLRKITYKRIIIMGATRKTRLFAARLTIGQVNWLPNGGGVWLQS